MQRTLHLASLLLRSLAALLVAAEQCSQGPATSLGDEELLGVGLGVDSVRGRVEVQVEALELWK